MQSPRISGQPVKEIDHGVYSVVGPSVRCFDVDAQVNVAMQGDSRLRSGKICDECANSDACEVSGCNVSVDKWSHRPR
jgi:hypothetical protein